MTAIINCIISLKALRVQLYRGQYIKLSRQRWPLLQVTYRYIIILCRYRSDHRRVPKVFHKRI